MYKAIQNHNILLLIVDIIIKTNSSKMKVSVAKNNVIYDETKTNKRYFIVCYLDFIVSFNFIFL